MNNFNVVTEITQSALTQEKGEMPQFQPLKMRGMGHKIHTEA